VLFSVVVASHIYLHTLIDEFNGHKEAVIVNLKRDHVFTKNRHKKVQPLNLSNKMSTTPNHSKKHPPTKHDPFTLPMTDILSSHGYLLCTQCDKNIF